MAHQTEAPAYMRHAADQLRSAQLRAALRQPLSHQPPQRSSASASGTSSTATGDGLRRRRGASDPLSERMPPRRLPPPRLSPLPCTAPPEPRGGLACRAVRRALSVARRSPLSSPPAPPRSVASSLAPGLSCRLRLRLRRRDLRTRRGTWADTQRNLTCGFSSEADDQRFCLRQLIGFSVGI